MTLWSQCLNRVDKKFIVAGVHCCREAATRVLCCSKNKLTRLVKFHDAGNLQPPQDLRAISTANREEKAPARDSCNAWFQGCYTTMAVTIAMAVESGVSSACLLVYVGWFQTGFSSKQHANFEKLVHPPHVINIIPVCCREIDLLNRVSNPMLFIGVHLVLHMLLSSRYTGWRIFDGVGCLRWCH